MKYIPGTKAKARLTFHAINRAEGLPIRGETIGGSDCVPSECLVDEAGFPLPTPGWTTAALEEPIEAPTLAVLAIPEHLEKHLGKTVIVAGVTVTLPLKSELVSDESELPEELRALLQSRREATSL